METARMAILDALFVQVVKHRACLIESVPTLIRGRYSTMDRLIGALANIVRHAEGEVIEHARVEREIEHRLHFVKTDGV